MIGLAGGLLGQPWLLRLLKWGAVVLAVLGVLLAARNSGRQAERVDNLERAITAARRRRDEESLVRRMPDGAVLDELHRTWSRD